MERTEWKYWIASITDTCNNRCPGCYRVLQNNLQWVDVHMPIANFEKILGIFVEQGGDSIDLVGGEPTLHPNFLEIAKLSVDAGIKLWIYTNLREFGCKPELAEQVLNIGGDITVVGKLNVPNPEDSAHRMCQAVLIGAEQKAVYQMWQGLQNLLVVGFPKGRVGIENLLRSTNIDFAPQVYEVGLQRGFFVDLEIPTCPVMIGIDPFESAMHSFRQWLKFLPAKEQILGCIEAIEKINECYGIAPYVPMMPHLTGRNSEGVGTGCVAFKQGALLTETDGAVRMCTSGIPLIRKVVHQGWFKQLNILHHPLEEIFSHPDLIARRESCSQENIKSGHCATCKFWHYCLGGCAALRENLGSIFGSYPLCYMHEWLSEEELIRLFSRGWKHKMSEFSDDTSGIALKMALKRGLDSDQWKWMPEDKARALKSDLERILKIYF